MDGSSERRGKSRAPKRDIYQRRQYAALRAVRALDRVGRTASGAEPAERERALRWMRLWIAFAASRDAAAAKAAVRVRDAA